jgi:molecular chaperone Hsp33
VEQLIENIRKVPFITELLRQGKTPEDILAMIFSGIPYHVLGKRNLFLRCTCSRERIERVLISLGSEELQRIIAEQGQTDVTCEFCRSNYHFTRKELEDLRSEISLR